MQFHTNVNTVESGLPTSRMSTVADNYSNFLCHQHFFNTVTLFQSFGKHTSAELFNKIYTFRQVIMSWQVSGLPDQNAGSATQRELAGL